MLCKEVILILLTEFNDCLILALLIFISKIISIHLTLLLSFVLSPVSLVYFEFEDDSRYSLE